MRHFPAEEFNDDLHFIALIKESQRVIELCVEIVRVDAAFELNFFQFDDLTLLALFFFALFLFEAEFAVIILQTGGTESGAIWTRSSSASFARRNASASFITPSWVPSAPITRTSFALISSFMREEDLAAMRGHLQK